jgi:hypothetical protein
MAANQYHILSFTPATEGWEMPPALEALAQQLVASGKLRVNADHERNFVLYREMTFSLRELSDARLKAATESTIARHVAPAAGAQGIDDIWAFLRNEIKKARGISPEKELRVARVLVQSADPAVIQLLIATGAQVFVSYSHNVADLMPVHEWQGHGVNSGLQATEREGAAVYISCGGDPFFEGAQKTYTTDGFPALARMVVIAGQELGHFADLRRTPRGIIGRYSTDIHASQLRADPTAASARLADIATVEALAATYRKAGLNFLLRAEKGVAFYHQRLRYSPPWFLYQLWRFLAWLWFIFQCSQKRLWFKFNVLPYHRLGETIQLFLADMAFNLTPDADAYRHPDPLIEEAILVIEAVARVPQQIHKWGKEAVFASWPALSLFYFDTVITSCRAAVKKQDSHSIMSLRQKIIVSIKRQFRARPGYCP